MSATAIPTQTTTAAVSSPSTRTAAGRPVWLVAVLAGLAGAAVTEVFTLAARGLGVPMDVATGSATKAAEIPVGGVATAVLMWSVAGIVLAMALARWAKRPARTFVVTTAVLTAASLAAPALTTHTATSTQILLAVAHVVAAAVIVPPVAHRLSRVQR